MVSQFGGHLWCRYAGFLDFTFALLARCDDSKIVYVFYALHVFNKTPITAVEWSKTVEKLLICIEIDALKFFQSVS